jgi:chemotaxis protein MotA
VEIEDPFLAKGVRFIADGYDTGFIRDNLERDRDNFLTHLDEGQKIYRAIGDCAPAFGMIRTLLGMVQMFANMTDPSKLGPFMATALLATLYGAVVANLCACRSPTSFTSSWRTRRSTAPSSSTASS